VNPDKDGGAFGDGGGGDHDLDPNGNGGDEGRKKLVSRSGLFGCGRRGRRGSGLFRFSSADIDLASNSSIADAIFYSRDVYVKKSKIGCFPKRLIAYAVCLYISQHKNFIVEILIYKMVILLFGFYNRQKCLRPHSQIQLSSMSLILLKLADLPNSFK
jgi:hypothetical protein